MTIETLQSRLERITNERNAVLSAIHGHIATLEKYNGAVEMMQKLIAEDVAEAKADAEAEEIDGANAAMETPVE